MSGSTLEARATTQWKPTDAWLLGVVLAVINFWLFAQTLLNVIPGIQEELGIRTSAVRNRQQAENATSGGDTAGPSAQSGSAPALSVATDTPPVVPARVTTAGPDIELGPVCGDCGGMMQRTGACYTCSSCGNNTGCG